MEFSVLLKWDRLFLGCENIAGMRKQLPGIGIIDEYRICERDELDFGVFIFTEPSFFRNSLLKSR